MYMDMHAYYISYSCTLLQGYSKPHTVQKQGYLEHHTYIVVQLATIQLGLCTCTYMYTQLILTCIFFLHNIICQVSPLVHVRILYLETSVNDHFCTYSTEQTQATMTVQSFCHISTVWILADVYIYLFIVHEGTLYT